MINNEQIKNTIDHFRDEGKSIRVRDIAYTLLAKMFDAKTAFQCLFSGEEYIFDSYAEDKMRGELESYLVEQGFIRNIITDNDSGGITFNENKREMEMLLKKTQDALDEGIIEPKDALKIMADIRVKLNDKFKVEAQKTERTIIVQKRYNSTCQHCGREIYIPTKEQLMNEFNLIENPNSNGSD